MRTYTINLFFIEFDTVVTHCLDWVLPKRIQEAGEGCAGVCLGRLKLFVSVKLLAQTA